MMALTVIGTVAQFNSVHTAGFGTRYPVIAWGEPRPSSTRYLCALGQLPQHSTSFPVAAYTPLARLAL